jgi:hypothetical protein
MWKNGTGEEESATGGPPGIFATTASMVHGAFAPLALRIPRSVLGQLRLLLGLNSAADLWCNQHAVFENEGGATHRCCHPPCSSLHLFRL